MKKLLFILLSIISFSIPSFSQTMEELRKEQNEINAQLTSMKNVNIMQLSTNMLQNLPKGKSDSPLSILAKQGNLLTIKVYELGNAEAEKTGRRLLQNYLSQMTLQNNVEPDIIVRQADDSNEVLIYGEPNNSYRTAFNSLVIFSSQKGDKSILIRIYGFVEDKTVAELINAFSK